MHFFPSLCCHFYLCTSFHSTIIIIVMLQKIWKIVGVCLLKWINTDELVGAVEMITVEGQGGQLRQSLLR